MRTWDITVTTSLPMLDEDGLMAVMDVLPAGATVGRSSWSDRLALVVPVLAPLAVDAASIGTAIAEQALLRALGGTGTIVAVEALEETETELRSAEPGPLALVSVEQAADLLGISGAAVRARAAKGEFGAVKVGDTGHAPYVLRRQAVEREAQARM